MKVKQAKTKRGDVLLTETHINISVEENLACYSTTCQVSVRRLSALFCRYFFSPVTVSHLVSREGQNGHHSDPQGQMKQVDGYLETSEQQGGANGGNAPRPSQEEQQGVMEGVEDKSWDGQDEPEQCGGQPGVQRQRGHEDHHRCLAHGHGLKPQHTRDIIKNHYCSMGEVPNFFAITFQAIVPPIVGKLT